MKRDNVEEKVYDIAREAARWYKRIENLSLTFQKDSGISSELKDKFSSILDEDEENSSSNISVLNLKDKIDLSLLIASLVVDKKTIFSRYNVNLDAVLEQISGIEGDLEDADFSEQVYKDIFEPLITKISFEQKYVDSNLLALYLLDPNFSSYIITDILDNIFVLDDYGNLLSNDFLGAYKLNLNKYTQEHSESNDDRDSLGFYLTDKDFITNPAVGRDKEINDALVSLITGSVIVLGDSGVGKSAVVEGIAYRLQNDLVPKCLKGYKILQINVNDLVAGSGFRGEFEKRVQEIIKKVKDEEKTILFVDEIHTVKGAGVIDSGKNDLISILNPYLADGSIKIIGTTSNYEYQEYFADDDTFRRRFDIVKVKEPDFQTLMQIINASVTKYEDLVGVPLDFTDIEREKVFSTLIKDTEKGRVQNDRQYNPSLVLSLVKKAFAYAAFNDRDSVSIDDFCEAVSSCERFYGWHRGIMQEHLRNAWNIEQKEEQKVMTKTPMMGQIIEFRPRV